MIDQLHQINNAEMQQKSLVETILQLRRRSVPRKEASATFLA